MIQRAVKGALCAAAFISSVYAQEGAIPKGVPHLDHVFVIVMENHGYQQITGNPEAPFINGYAKSANLATNYFAVAHPSLTNYLEVVGGSNFGVLNDNSPDWHNTSCTANVLSGTSSLDNGTAPAICPIYGTGTDAATPVRDFSNETSGNPGAIEIDDKLSIPANPATVGKTIADQVAAGGLTWKSYQESLPPSGADKVDNADGYYSNLSDLSAALPGEKQTQANLVALYAVKHNPFAYFRSIQEDGLGNMASFDGNTGLFADLASGHVPNYSLIAPNQCNDMHGRGNAGPVCEGDPNNNGTQQGLNPGLIRQGDYTVQRIVNAIHHSPVWKQQHAAIVLLWDENDYSVAPITNQVVTIVDTNFGAHHVQSGIFYDHFSVLKSIEAGLNLPCLNHACDANVSVMSDLFAGEGKWDSNGENDQF
jgi:hypothetical protein